jgi:hypothetical protein
MTPEHIHAIAHLRRVGRWDPPMVTAVLGHLNGADYYGPLLSMKELRWTPWERSALEAMAAVPPAQRAIAWEGGDANQAVRATLGQLPDVAEAIWQGLDPDGRRDTANGLLLYANRKLIVNIPHRDDVRHVAWALSHDGDPNAVDDRGDRPLHVAAQLGWFHRIEPLLHAGADPTLVNRRGDTPREAMVASMEQSNKSEPRMGKLNPALRALGLAHGGRRDGEILAALDHAILSRAATRERPSARRRM